MTRLVLCRVGVMLVSCHVGVISVLCWCHIGVVSVSCRAVLYCVVMSVCGFFMDVYNSEVQYRFTEEDLYDERPLVDRAIHFSSLLPAISLLTVVVTVTRK